MQVFTFEKLHGAGNDFILVDGRHTPLSPDDYTRIAALCDRHLGIGADGLMIVRPHSEADFELLYYNADGKLGSLCGNGSRCAVAFAQKIGLFPDKKGVFLASDGLHQAKRLPDGRVCIHMHDAPLPEKTADGGWFVDTGSPHHILLEAHELQAEEVLERGRKIRHSSAYSPGGTNVNFLSPSENKVLKIRTFERGVEAETLACGTGATAAALVAALKGYASPVKLQALGGELEVAFQQDIKGFSGITLTGPVAFVFKGELPWEDSLEESGW